MQFLYSIVNTPYFVEFQDCYPLPPEKLENIPFLADRFQIQDLFALTMQILRGLVAIPTNVYRQNDGLPVQVQDFFN